jgi:hypothetical protein
VTTIRSGAETADVFSTAAHPFTVKTASNRSERDFALPRRPSPETLDLLRATLTKLGQTETLAGDPDSISELKRVVLNRIADLELSQRLVSSDVVNLKAPERAELSPLPSTIEEGRLDELTQKTELDRQD